MKKKITLSIAAFVCIFSLSDSSVLAQGTSEYLNKSNINALINSSGILFQDDNLHQASFETPKGSGKHAIYSSSNWMGGMETNPLFVTDSLRLSEQTFVPSNFYVGPIDRTTMIGTTDSTYNRVWKIEKSDVDYHIQNYSSTSYNMPQSIADWPGNDTYGNTLASFEDLNNNGIYEPTQGDYPNIQGDQAILFIINDVGDGSRLYNDIDTNSGRVRSAGHIGVEIHGMAYAYSSNKSHVNNSIFLNVKVKNILGKSFRDFYFTSFNDFDLGYAFDDYVGSDSLRNLIYAYNGDANDESAGSFSGYGYNPPAIGVKLLNDALSSAVYYDNSPGASNGGPQWSQHYYNYMKAYWKNDQKMRYGGNGYNSLGVTNDTTNYMFTGNPNSSTNQGWTEGNPGNGQMPNPPADRRMIGTTGPFNFNDNDVLELDYAFIYAENLSNDSSNTTSVGNLLVAADSVQVFYDQEIAVGINENNIAESNFLIYPNPISSGSVLKLGLDNIDVLKIYDMQGKLIVEEQEPKQSIQLDESIFNTGIYIIAVMKEGKMFTTKLIIE